MVNTPVRRGIAFTVQPGGRRCFPGFAWKPIGWLGEGVVSGAESVDGFVVEKKNLTISDRHIGNKSKCVIYTKTGADWDRHT